MAHLRRNVEGKPTAWPQLNLGSAPLLAEIFQQRMRNFSHLTQLVRALDQSRLVSLNVVALLMTAQSPSVTYLKASRITKARARAKMTKARDKVTKVRREKVERSECDGRDGMVALVIILYKIVQKLKS